MTDRAGDEVRSWFGDDAAARRRRMDEVRDDWHRRDTGERVSRGWTDRGEGPAERAWDRARETVRDVTDRDRDGRRGLDEWRDDDRGRDRPYGAASRYGIGGLAPQRRWSGDETWDPPRRRPFGDTSRYANADDDWSRTSSSRYGRYPDTGDLPHAGYAGRGPRGYQRGDERIREDVCDRLTEDPRIDASDVEVQVKNGEVTLAGSVRSREEKRFAEDAIERIAGVRDVSNHLKVKPADEVLGTARSGASVLGLSDTPPAPPAPQKTK